MRNSEDQISDGELGLGGLLVWLAIFGAALAALEQLAGWPAQPALPDHLPSWNAIQVWLNSPLADIGPLLPVALDFGWIVWGLTAVSIALQVLVDLLDAATRGAAWVGSLRLATNWLVVPPIRRAVDASLSGLLLARVLVQPAAAIEAGGVPMANIAMQTPAHWRPPTSSSGTDIPRRGFRTEVVAFASDDQQPAAPSRDRQPAASSDSTLEVIYTVQRGDTLWALGGQFYGDPEQGAERIFEANQGRRQADGRVFNRRGLIFVGWTLRIPEPTCCIVRAVDGTWWYTVQSGDTLSEIGARLLGDPERWGEIFQLNRGAQAPDGHVLLDPNIIWAGLKLRLPLDGPPAPTAAPEPPAESAPAPPPAVIPETVVEPGRQDHSPPREAPARDVSPTIAPTPAPTPTPQETAAPVPATPTLQAPPTIRPVEQVRSESGHQVPPAAAAAGAAGLAAAGLVAGQLVVRKRKPWRAPDGPESDVVVQDGFAEVDPVEDLARRLAHTSGPASAIASLLGQAYSATFEERLLPDERHEVQGIAVAATKHGRTSTTLVLAAPVAARPHLVLNMRGAVERAFGTQVDVDGLVDQDGDVLVRVTWNPRHPVSADLLDRADASTLPSAWPRPCLVPAFLLYGGQQLAINWHTLSNVLVVAPTGQGADIPLTALVAALASVRAPEDLGLVVIARPHALPEEIGMFPHVLLDVVDPADREAVQRVLDDMKLEIDRRRQAGSSGDLVVVIRELGDLEPEAMAVAATIAATGPDYGVRLAAASERPVPELLKVCPFVEQLGTRLVRQTATEEDSVALLGMDGAEYLGAGGQALLRLEGRIPYRGRAHRVSPDRLARLVHMMGSRVRAVPTPSGQPDGDLAEPEDAEQPEEVPAEEVEEADAGDAQEAAGPAAPPVPNERAGPPGSPTWGSSLLRELRAAPIRVQCFGACDVRHGDRSLKIGDPELLLLLAVHPVAGVRGEAVADMLWGDTVPDDIAGALRKERSKVRLALRRLVPELGADPLPGNASHGEKVVVLNTSVVASDVHEFTELLKCAGKLDPPAAIEAYEAALQLYRGDLLDSSDMRDYRWLYSEDPQVGLMLRSDFRRRHKEARLKLAKLLAEGPESGLARAEELYWDLCGEDPENERLWTALFRIHERTGSSLGLEAAVRRLRNALVELGATEVTDIDSVPLPPNLERLVQQTRQRIGSNPVDPVAGGDSQ